ncbi:hypothetical protein CCP3SC15_1550009 [Gammaproteobacteria bacterium]
MLSTILMVLLWVDTGRDRKTPVLIVEVPEPLSVLAVTEQGVVDNACLAMEQVFKEASAQCVVAKDNTTDSTVFHVTELE